MIRAVAGLMLLASPAFAQDTGPREQMAEGFMACMSGGGRLDLTESMLADAMSWTRDDGEEGLLYFYPGDSDSTFVILARDGSFCHVESMVIDSSTAAQLLAVTLAPPDGAPFVYSKTDMGCTRLDFDTGVMATITSGGNDPVCGSETDSAVRFEFSAAS